MATSTAMTAEQALEVQSDIDSPNGSDEGWEGSEEDEESEEDATVDEMTAVMIRPVVAHCNSR